MSSKILPAACQLIRYYSTTDVSVQFNSVVSQLACCLTVLQPIAQSDNTQVVAYSYNGSDVSDAIFICSWHCEL